MERFIWFGIFNCIGVFFITCAFPEVSTKQILGLILGIQFMATALDCLDHTGKKD